MVRNVASADSRRYVGSSSGVISAMVPDCEVCKMWWSGVGGGPSRSISEGLALGSPELLMEVMVGESVERRRVSRVGKWPVWKVDLWRRRWPERDLGSVLCC